MEESREQWHPPTAARPSWVEVAGAAASPRPPQCSPASPHSPATCQGGQQPRLAAQGRGWGGFEANAAARPLSLVAQFPLQRHGEDHVGGCRAGGDPPPALLLCGQGAELGSGSFSHRQAAWWQQQPPSPPPLVMVGPMIIMSTGCRPQPSILFPDSGTMSGRSPHTLPFLYPPLFAPGGNGSRPRMPQPPTLQAAHLCVAGGREALTHCPLLPPGLPHRPPHLLPPSPPLSAAQRSRPSWSRAAGAGGASCPPASRKFEQDQSNLVN